MLYLSWFFSGDDNALPDASASARIIVDLFHYVYFLRDPAARPKKIINELLYQKSVLPKICLKGLFNVSSLMTSPPKTGAGRAVPIMMARTA